MNPTITAHSYEALAKFHLHGISNWNYSGLTDLLLGRMNKSSNKHKILELVKKDGFNYQEMSDMLIRLERVEERIEKIEKFGILSDNSIDGISAARYLGISKRTLDNLYKIENFSYLTNSRRLYIPHLLEKYRLEQVEKERQAIIKPVAPSSNEQNIKKVASKKDELYLPIIENFTSIFIREEYQYLIVENVKLMNNFFSNVPLPEGIKIQWDGTPKALLTFFYLIFILGLVETNNVRKHGSHLDESKEDTEQKGITYLALVSRYFKFSNGVAVSKSTLSRLWIGNKDIKNSNGIRGAICYLQEQVKEYFTTEKDSITKKLALNFYFENKDRKKFKINDEIDIEMLNIVGEVYLKYFKKEETTRKPLIGKPR